MERESPVGKGSKSRKGWAAMTGHALYSPVGCRARRFVCLTFLLISFLSLARLPVFLQYALEPPIACSPFPPSSTERLAGLGRHIPRRHRSL